MMKFIIFIFIGFLSLVGCATTGSLAKLPPITDVKSTGKVFIIRNYNFFGSGVEYGIWLDGRKTFALKTKQYTLFTLNSGEHFLGVEGPNGWGGMTTKQTTVSIKENDVFYFLLSPSGFGCDIEPISKDEGEDRMASSEYLPAIIETKVDASPTPVKGNSASDILKQRYANGELNREQFETMKKEIGE